MRKKILGLLAVIGTLAGSAVLLAGGPADAQKVANTGPGQLILDSGDLRIGDQSFEAGSAEEQVVANINVGADGNFTISSLTFPPLPPIAGPLGDIDVTISLISGSGHVNPLTGLTNLNFSIRIDVDGTGVGGDCKVTPITISASTTKAGGVPYNPVDGRVTLADHGFSVPGASGCATFPINVNNEINSQLGLPSSDTDAVFSGFFSPIRQRSINPSFTAVPDSGYAPLPVAFDASATTSSKAATYQWDFTNDGSFDDTGVTTNFVYASPGTYTARLRVTDTDGDFAETTRQVQVLEPFPDATLDKSGPAALIHGEAGTYELVVGSEGELPVSGATVVDTLPAGLAYTGYSGAGWTCDDSSLPVLTCESADVVAPGDTFPTLSVDVVADGSVVGVVTNAATVSTPGEVDTSDNADSVDTQLIQDGIDLTVNKVHDEDEGLFAGETATYTITVGNEGTQPATETVVVTDPLPDGTTYVGASGGLDWVCSYDPGTHTVTCFSHEDVAPGGSLADINVVVELTNVESPLSNTATVSVTGESNPANDSDTDTGTVLGLAVDYQVLKTHLGDLVVGETTTYGIGVQNVGTTTGSADVVVTDELPAGLTYVGAVGDGWTCGAVGQTVTCEHAGGVEPGDLLPGITLQVAVDDAALPEVTNTATVASADDTNALNDSSSVTSEARVPAPDLDITKSHVGNFVTASEGTWTIAVTNLSTDRADGPTVVTDTLPAGVDFVSASGTDWTCDASGLPQVTCTYAGVIDGLASAPPISVVVFAPDGAPDLVVNGATVANAADVDPSNDATFDPTRIDPRAAAPTTLEADAIVLRLKLLGATPLSISLLNAPYATLTSEGVPLPGKTVSFRTVNGAALCSAVTNAQGVATCSGTGNFLQTLLGLRYVAEFAGDFDYQASSAEAAIIHLQGLKLL